MTKKITSALLEALWYLVVFAVAQYVVAIGVNSAAMLWHGAPAEAVWNAIAHGSFQLSSKVLVLTATASSVVAIGLFVWRKWTVVSPTYLRTRPWGVFFWAIILALGTILPSQWLQERIDLQMPEAAERMFEAILGTPWGYFAVGILTPIAEEMVFRGAILRTLLHAFGPRLRWVAIFASALLFGLIHGNQAQFAHALLIGIILGWLYCRTGSILPGVVLHWVNNTVAYVMFNAMPHMADGKLIDFFHGSYRTMWLGLLFSLFLIVPSLFQLHLRMRKANDKGTPET